MLRINTMYFRRQKLKKLKNTKYFVEKFEIKMKVLYENTFVIVIAMIEKEKLEIF